MPATQAVPVKPGSISSILQRIVRAITTVPKRTWIGMGIAVGLWWIFMHYTRWPAVRNKSEILTVLAAGAPNTFSELVSRQGWSYWLSWIPTGINMNDNNAIGMAFAFLIGGAVASLVLPQGLVNRILFGRGTRGAVMGGLLGAPLMMCSACSVPIAVGWRNRGANLETTLGVVTGASLLNVMGLLTISVLFPWPLAWGRITASLIMVVLATPLIAWISNRLLGHRKGVTIPEGVREMAGKLDFSDPVSKNILQESWPQAFKGAVISWWWTSVGIAYRLFLPMTGAIFLAAFVRLFVPPVVVETYLGGGLLAIVIVSLFGSLIAIPTMFEIPMVIGFIFLGMGYGPAASLLVTAPSVSIVSYFMLRKDVGHLPPLLLLGATFIIGVLVGLAVELGVSIYG